MPACDFCQGAFVFISLLCKPMPFFSEQLIKFSGHCAKNYPEAMRWISLKGIMAYGYSFQG